MSQSISTSAKIASSENQVFLPSAQVTVADGTYNTNGTISAVKDHGVAGLVRIRARVRIKAVDAAGPTGQIILKVSTTSAMTTPEFVGVIPSVTPSATTDVMEVTLYGWSNSGFRYSQLSVAGLSTTASTVTYDAVVDAL